MLMLLCKFSIAQDIKLTSPNGKLSANIQLKEEITYNVYYADVPLITKATLALQLRDVNLGAKPNLKRQSITAVKNELRPVVPLKFSKINNEYNLLRMDFGGDYTVEFRAYNEAIAYRFITRKKGAVDVINENLSIQFPEDYQLHLQQLVGLKQHTKNPIPILLLGTGSRQTKCRHYLCS